MLNYISRFDLSGILDIFLLSIFRSNENANMYTCTNSYPSYCYFTPKIPGFDSNKMMRYYNNRTYF